MYIPDPFSESDPAILKEFIGRNPFATVITGTGSELKISHIPMYYSEENGKAFLVGHVAKANDHWRCLGRESGAKSTAIFHGPHAYVSSRWYGARNGVPTWNYIAVHVSGFLATVDGNELGLILDLMLKKHEGDPGTFNLDLDDNVRRNLENHIVGVKMAIETMEGKWKLSQNKSLDIQDKVAQRLSESGDWNAGQVAGFMRAKIRTEEP